ncbi:beta-carotene 15,15'-monooxygenase [Streptococcus sp. NLN76]|uniref:beta-carotene 15,15'-monooxygenase n=1 Tax=Streptococcus sp. NLN76 TaxID=2822800 RepID=UPI0018A90E92|nr:beta-carotene 15,15'-monooxygenase [Streptococcus sp. NLN76]
MRRFFNYLGQFGNYLVLLLAGLFCAFFSFSTLFVTTFIPIKISEGVLFQVNPWYFFPCLLLFLWGLLRLGPIFERISDKQFFRFLTILYIVMGAYLLFNVEGQIRADAKHVYKAALAFNQDDFESLTTIGAYMYRNPHQLGLLSLERIYAAILPTTYLAFGMNLVWTLTNNYLIWRLGRTWGFSQLARNYLLFFSFAFLPHFFFILFVYGSTVGLTACLLALTSYQTFARKEQLRYGFLTALFLGLACVIRNNYMIFGLTILGILTLSILKEFTWKKVLVGISCIICMVGMNKAVLSYYEGVIGQEIGPGTPKIAYVTMGLRDDPDRKTLGGWYDGYNTKILQRNNFNEEQATEMAKRDLRKRIVTFIKDPIYAFRFFFQKIYSTWTEPTFQSIWTGPNRWERNQETFTPLLQSLYEGRTAYRIFHFSMSLLLWTIYSFAALYLFHLFRKIQPDFPSTQLAGTIFLMGGFLFHLIWETKSQYVYMYILLLTPYAAQGVELTLSYLNKKKKTIRT